MKCSFSFFRLLTLKFYPPSRSFSGQCSLISPRLGFSFAPCILDYEDLGICVSEDVVGCAGVTGFRISMIL